MLKELKGHRLFQGWNSKRSHFDTRGSLWFHHIRNPVWMFFMSSFLHVRHRDSPKMSVFRIAGSRIVLLRSEWRTDGDMTSQCSGIYPALPKEGHTVMTPEISVSTLSSRVLGISRFKGGDPLTRGQGICPNHVILYCDPITRPLPTEQCPYSSQSKTLRGLSLSSRRTEFRSSSQDNRPISQ